MDNIKSYIVSGLMLMAGLMPAIDYSLPIFMAAKYWHWWVLMSGFLGFYTMFLKVPFIIKFTAVGIFILCFFSAAPAISFTQYIIVVSCCYFYILCLSIKDYSIIKRCLQCLLLFNLLFFTLQVFNKDALLNFGLSEGIRNYGIVGQHMQSASFIVILSAALIPLSPLNMVIPFVVSVICNSAGAFLAVSVGVIYYLSNILDRKTILKLSFFLFLILISWMLLTNKFVSNFNMNINGGRLLIWIKTVKLSLEHPFTGYGIATYKSIFPQISHIYGTVWRTAHNTWLQLIWETGYIFSSVLIGYFFYLIYKIHKMTKRKILRGTAIKLIAGLLIIGTDMQFHFPDRTIQSALIIVFFFAYCQKFVNGGIKNGGGQNNSSQHCPG